MGEASGTKTPSEAKVISHCTACSKSASDVAVLKDAVNKVTAKDTDVKMDEIREKGNPIDLTTNDSSGNDDNTTSDDDSCAKGMKVINDPSNFCDALTSAADDEEEDDDAADHDPSTSILQEGQ